MVGYPSGQRGQTVNLLAHAFDGSNPSPTTTAFFLSPWVANPHNSAKPYEFVQPDGRSGSGDWGHGSAWRSAGGRTRAGGGESRGPGPERRAGWGARQKNQR